MMDDDAGRVTHGQVKLVSMKHHGGCPPLLSFMQVLVFLPSLSLFLSFVSFVFLSNSPTGAWPRKQMTKHKPRNGVGARASGRGISK
jgi:hypothetical protein